jgi:hypothetical protein
MVREMSISELILARISLDRFLATKERTGRSIPTVPFRSSR